MLTEQANSGQTVASSSSGIRPVHERGSGVGLRLGGARADFVASLGRKVLDLRAASARVRENPGELALREALRRRMHALSSAAKMMKFDAMDRAIAEALGIIDRTDLDVPLEPVDLDSIDQVIGDLPSLAWGDSDARPSHVEAVAKPARRPVFNALIVGSAQIAEALLDELPADEGGTPSRLAFVCESTPDAQAAFDLARSTDPDLVILDADLDYASELVEALMDEPLTEATPLVVIGSFLEPGESARYVAMGVARTLAKPTSKASLRSACEAAVSARSGAAHIAPVGSLPRSEHVDLAHGDRSPMRLRGPAPEVRLEGRSVVIADDDPAVVWFLADLLKSVGCEVHEAFDGVRALELTYRTNPDLLLCDIMMPGLDGFSLCRKLRHDVALRDLPVILLSWKEDLLQRVRELGAGAAGYVRKEADTRAILARIREALRPRAHVEMRLADGTGEVRGRMDGLSVRTLLEIVCKVRPDARISMRDASFNYEIEVRAGAPVRATRTSGDGSALHGTKAWTLMLGASAGRFTVATSAATVEADLEGSLSALLAAPVLHARAVTALLGSQGTKACRVRLDEQALEDYLRATPDLVRTIALRLADGSTPRSLLLEGIADAALIEDLASDLAARGVILGVEDDKAFDLVGPEILRLKELHDVQEAAPSVGPPPEDVVTKDCAADHAAPRCESPSPTGVTASKAEASSLEEAVIRELANRSPEPAALEPNVAMAASEPSPSPQGQVAFLAERTEIDGTLYAAREPSIPIDEMSVPIDDSRATRTPLTAVTSEDTIPGLAGKRKAWPVFVFAAASGIVAWAAVHFSLASVPPKRVETAPPAPAQLPIPAAESVTYTSAAPSTVATGQGSLEVSGPGDAVIVVDGTDRGRGFVTLSLPAGMHEVRLGGFAARQVDVRLSKVAHVKF